MKLFVHIVFVLGIILKSMPLIAAVSPDEAAKLNSTLTPLGAERAGNTEGTIPAWAGGLIDVPTNYVIGKHHPNPFPKDKVMFTITASNMADHAKHLTEGQKALFRTYPNTFTMNIYPTQRSAAIPQWVYDNTAKNATSARLAKGGNGIQNVYGGIPFPIPQTGVEVIWNHITRWRGKSIDRTGSETSVHRNGSYTLSRLRQEADFIYYQQGDQLTDNDNLLFYYRAHTYTPARLAGRAVLVHEPIDQVKEKRDAWIYNTGQRRVRRAPTLSHDTPSVGSDSIRLTDDVDMYNGAPDRYDWKIIGKKEIYIPYNNYLLSSPQVKYNDILHPGHINPELARYELHRVWVVEATLKPNNRHLYARRVFYLDEDSWNIAIVDKYDGRGELWRIGMAYLKQFYGDLNGIFTVADVFHDLQARRYNVQGLDTEESSTVLFNKESQGKGYYTPAALRRLGKR